MSLLHFHVLNLIKYSMRILMLIWIQLIYYLLKMLDICANLMYKIKILTTFEHIGKLKSA